MAVVESALHNLLQKIAEEQKYRDSEIQVTPISTGGANYSSNLRVAKITSRTKEDLDLFIKISTIGAKLREEVTITIFETEKIFYSNIQKAYKDIENKFTVPEEHRLRTPEYYGADNTPPNEILVLENVAVQGFRVHDRFKSIDWQYASTAVNELVKLHSFSIAYRREYPEAYQHFIDNHQYEWLNYVTMKHLWVEGFKKAEAATTDGNKIKLKKFYDEYDLEKVKRQYDPIRCKVLTHGDFRPSNLMNKTRDDGSLEIIVVDHQTIQVGCPVTDLLYLIFTGTDKAFRAKYYDKLVDHYYTQLSEAMKRLDIDPETTYSRGDFDFELKEKLPFGLTVAAFTLPIVTVETENAPTLNNDVDLSSFSIHKTSSIFIERINGVVDDFVRWGVLKD